MMSPISGLPAGIAGLSARGTVLAQDVAQALKLVVAGSRLVVEVEPAFDGYMSELVGGLKDACEGGSLRACALVVPEGMLAEAREPGDGGNFRVFAAGARAEALAWLGRL